MSLAVAAAGAGIRARGERIARSRALRLSLVALGARAITFGNPILHVDEEFYFVFARALAGGGLPYVDMWDRKPIGLFLLYLPAALLGPVWGVLAVQAMALAAVVATALLLARLADRAGWTRGAVPAAALYILWLDLADGQGGQAPVFYNLLMVAAATLVAADLAVEGGAWRRRGFGIAAMALVGLALQVKYAVVFEGAWFGLWLLWREWRTGTRLIGVLAHAIALMLVALAPTLVVAAGYAWAGHGEAFVYANFTSILQRRSDPIAESLSNLATVTVLLVPLVAMAVLGRRAAPVPAGVRSSQRFLRSWLAAALLGLLVFGSWFNHYALPAMAPAACCAAALIAGGRRGRIAGWCALALGAVAGQIVLLSERNIRGTPQQFARIVDAIGPGTGGLYVYSGSTMLYARTGRAAPTALFFPNHLMLERERGAVGVDQPREVNRILDTHPEIVVMQSLDGGEWRAVRQMVLRRLSRGRYRPGVPFVIGDKTVTIYRRSLTTMSPPRS